MVTTGTAMDLVPAVEYSILVFFYHRSATHFLTSPTICLCILSSSHMSVGAKFYDDSESVFIFQIGPTFLEISRKNWKEAEHCGRIRRPRSEKRRVGKECRARRCQDP